MVVATLGLALFEPGLLTAPSYCTRTGKMPVGKPARLPGLLGTSTLICHSPGYPGAKPEYLITPSALPMWTTGWELVETAPGATPSPGAPGINPWPVR